MNTILIPFVSCYRSIHQSPSVPLSGGLSATEEGQLSLPACAGGLTGGET